MKDRYPETFLGDPEIDFVLLAKSQGIEGERVSEPADLAAAMTRAKDAQAGGAPYVLDVKIANLGAGSGDAATWKTDYTFNAAAE